MCPNDGGPSETERAEIERNRGILTSSDRELLLGYADELSDRAEEQRMVRIRRRVRDSLMDGLELLELEPSDRKLIFAPQKNASEVQGGAIMLIKFLYMGLQEHGNVDVKQVFMDAIEDAEKRLGEEQGEYRNPRASLSVNLGNRYDKETLRSKLDSGKSMKPAETVGAMEILDLSSDDWEKLREANESAVEEELERYRTGVPLDDLDEE